MSKLHNDIRRMIRNLKIIEQYNNFMQLNATEDILFLKQKVENLYNIKNNEELIEEFKNCANMVNSFYDQIDPEFKKKVLEDDKKEYE